MAQRLTTIGQLARRIGVSIKTLRDCERLGLLYTRGRSDSNYRLFDEETFWCIQLIRTMLSLGLTIEEIQAFAAQYVAGATGPIGPSLQHKLSDASRRIEARIAELQAVRERIHAFQSAHAAELAGRAELSVFASDPRRVICKLPLDSPRGVRV